MATDNFELVLASAADYSPQPNPAMAARQEFVRLARDEIDAWLPGLPEFGSLSWHTKYGGIQGNVSPVPWVRLFDPRYSPRTTEGFYLCWLFAGTGNNLYLSLNQGTSEFRSGKWRPITDSQIVQARADDARRKISVWPNELVERGLTEIDLGSDTLDIGAEAAGRIRNYEVGHITGFAYQAGDVPEESQLLGDLRLVLPLLAELYEPTLATPASVPPAGAVGSSPSKSPASGQGRSTDRRLNRAIELHSMAVAIEHYSSQGWTCVDVSSHKPYDIELHLDDSELHVEVKGTRSAAAAVNLTMGEVRHAMEYPNCALFVVSGISITYDAGEPRAHGGTASICDPWQIESDRLLATDYRYRLAGHAGMTSPGI